MLSFTIKTKTKNGEYIFLTKANNGKDALKNLIEHSGDFKQILQKRESNNMIIEVNKNEKKINLK